MYRSSRFIPAMLLAAVLAGCATGGAPLSNPNAAAAAYRDTLERSGRLSVTYQKDGQPQNVSVLFRWTQQPGRIDVALDSQLGSTLAQISVTPQAATLTQSGHAPRTEKDIDSLTRRTLGWSLPVNGLADWLQGYATDASGKRFAASPANNNVFTDDGWRLRFAEWQDGPKGSGGAMPRIIRAGRAATADSEELSVNIVVDPVQ
ncbi:outer membrane lipoprotein LolB [uncultured Massilia sp.]|uniref:outer membrane lipoprotein LolB n=1 Tax=uncultured Massilia sp. TaxID=169973 RepID=UPI0025D1780A|nr:outer membrane lipoprotein LolB [uncultured Massilia sp.]